ncbi:MAG: thymidine phosphorylase [Deltaproteobacteria bacterium]|nr:thymidine phosphorylase [Deltaproteobacteria bacterium]
MRAYDLIKHKRDGGALTSEQVRALVAGYVDGSVADYQMAAFAMAVFFRGMSGDEVVGLTQAMLHSGIVVDLADVPGVKVDKHSTGGVGDKISLPLAPAVAACGVPVPMVSGRGLGHTGGTLDKLESIPGFKVDLPLTDYRRLVRDLGCCLIGQTKEIAPADKKLYALRDVTATVDCIPLIASSIMSKKLAEGIDALVLDVKVGSGAFMKKRDDAATLARTMVELGAGMGKQVVARLTSMEQPLGALVGNALEVLESIEVLSGGGPKDVVELTVELGAEMLVLGKVARDVADGRARISKSLQDGSAKERFGRIIEAQGGDRRVLDDVRRLPTAPRTLPVPAPRAGYVTAVDTEAVGIASMLLGGGRQRASDAVDPRVGLAVHRRIGDRVEAGEPLVTLHVADAGVDAAAARARDAFVIGDGPVPAPALFLERIAGGTA